MIEVEKISPERWTFTVDLTAFSAIGAAVEDAIMLCETPTAPLAGDDPILLNLMLPELLAIKAKMMVNR